MREPPGAGCALTSGFWSVSMACSPDAYHLQAQPGQASPLSALAEITCVFREQAEEQRVEGLGGHWICNPLSFCICLCRNGPVGFQQRKYEGLQLLRTCRGSWQWSRAWGCGACNSDCPSHPPGTEISRGSFLHLLHLCRKRIPTTEELNTSNHYKADGSYLCSPCPQWENKAS